MSDRSDEAEKPEFLRILDEMTDKVIVFKDVFYTKQPFFQRTFQQRRVKFDMQSS